jgi:hypothetical protein
LSTVVTGETLHVECQSCRALLAVKDIGTYKCRAA